MADIKHWGLPCACKLACLSVCLSCVQLESVWDGVWRLPRPSQGGLQRCFITAGMSAALVHNNKKDKRPFSMPCLLCGAFITWPLRERTALDKLGRENTGGQVHPNEREREVFFFHGREIKVLHGKELQFYVPPQRTTEREGLCHYVCML